MGAQVARGLLTAAACRAESLQDMGTRSVLFEVALALLAVALGIVVRGTTAAIVLFATAGVLLVAAIISTDWLWRHVARRVEPHLRERAAPVALPAPTQQAAAEGVEVAPSRPSDTELVTSIDDVLDELATIDSRLMVAIADEYYRYDFYLPSAEYTKHRSVIGARSSEARKAIGEAYVMADELNWKMPGGTSDGIEMGLVAYPRADSLRHVVDRAMNTLRRARPVD